jgi:hypothetical protein
MSQFLSISFLCVHGIDFKQHRRHKNSCTGVRRLGTLSPGRGFWIGPERTGFKTGRKFAGSQGEVKELCHGRLRSRSGTEWKNGEEKKLLLLFLDGS